MINIIGKSLVVSFEILTVFLNGSDIISDLKNTDIREIMYSTESEVFMRAVNSDSGKFAFDLQLDDNKYSIGVLFSKDYDELFNKKKLSKKIEFDFQIESVLKEDNLVTYSMKTHERELILKDFEREVMTSGAYSTSGNVSIITIINDLEYYSRGKFFRKYTGKNI